MAFCSFSDGNVMFGTTPIENMFILEFMPAAPGDFVRVYIYGLMLCSHPELNEDIESIARALHMEKESVLSAYRYWEREGLVTRVSDNPPSFEYVPLTRARASAEADDGVYKYKNFYKELQLALPNVFLEGHELNIVNEWLDILKLNEEVVLEMVAAEVKRRAGKLPTARTLFRHLDETAKAWANAGVKSAAEAREFIRRSSAAAVCASAVIKQFGQSRPATKDEIDLAEKWLDEWKLTKEDVLLSCAETVKSSNPSFAYLDKILMSRLDSGETEKLRDDVKKLINHLGVIAKPTPAQLEAYSAFREMGFDFGAVEQAAIWCGENNRRTFDDVRRKLEQWKSVGVTTLEQIEEERRLQKYYSDIVLQVFDKCGIDRKIVKGDLQQVKIWAALMELDTVMFAAECARGTETPMKYIDKLIKAWSTKGARTLEAAKQEYEKFRAQPSANAQQTPKSDFAQRDIKKEEFETGFFVDPFEHGKASAQ